MWIPGTTYTRTPARTFVPSAVEPQTRSAFGVRGSGFWGSRVLGFSGSRSRVLGFSSQVLWFMGEPANRTTTRTRTQNPEPRTPEREPRTPNAERRTRVRIAQLPRSRKSRRRGDARRTGARHVHVSTVRTKEERQRSDLVRAVPTLVPAVREHADRCVGSTPSRRPFTFLSGGDRYVPPATLKARRAVLASPAFYELAGEHSGCCGRRRTVFPGSPPQLKRIL